jgi:hypothetical protein
MSRPEDDDADRRSYSIPSGFFILGAGNDRRTMTQPLRLVHDLRARKGFVLIG